MDINKNNINSGGNSKRNHKENKTLKKMILKIKW